MTDKKTIAIGISGGIAAYKIADLVSRLTKKGFQIEVIMTEAAQELVAPLTFSTLSGRPVHCEMFREENEVEHIAIGDRADLMVIVPATANIMAKAACGIADDLLSTVILAADSPVLFFPAMNTRMWEHPATQANVATLRSRGFDVFDPDEGFLACGTSGKGRLGSIDSIEETILDAMAALEKGKDLEGKTLLLSAGPTEEPIDPVRCITNRSSGKMGYAIAKAAKRRGADVHLVSGPVSLKAPDGVHLYPVGSAQEMKDQIDALYDRADITIMAAAVSDYHVKHVADQKIKKDGSTLILELEKNPDILASLGERKHGILVGFAAETQNLKENALSKLERKNLDMIVANNVTLQGAGFGSDTNIVTIYKKSGAEELPKMDKLILADMILDHILKLEEPTE
ncbi:MAG: bifunctional phosphopantothenoylcysteine decarboxylase/phosphopantothenate--cysteine ligase CoaBC [Firmicutes bacterium]|nr:bifunctional phosphopantothenoylcysteine decarboxylase/phosphopantothenate--cysteine ligase CoaBC [Bacillota bacterium]